MFSLKDKHIIVNYHYIRPPSNKWRGIHPCSPEEFERQVRFLSKHFRFAGIPEIFAAAQEESSERLCALTFDDGLKDNIQHAIPTLEKYNARGTFFLIAQVFEGLLPITHKSHIALSRLSSEEIVALCNDFFKKKGTEMVKKYFISGDTRITSERKMFDDVLTANFKETMSVLPSDISGAFLDSVLQVFGIQESDMIQEFFMDKKDVKTLAHNGHTIGSHAYSHNALDMLKPEEIEKEISQSKKILSRIANQDITLFSYPQSAPSKNIFDILKKGGVVYAAIVIERRAVRKGDNPLLVPRYDTNDIRDFMLAQ